MFILLWILLVPISLYINTETGRYTLSFPGIVHARVVPSDPLFAFRIRVLFIPFNIDPLNFNSRKKNQEKPGKRKKHPSMLKKMKTGKALMRSFRIRKLRLNLDTEDFMLNTALVPAFAAISRENIQLSANYHGEASLELAVRTRAGLLIWNYIRSI